MHTQLDTHSHIYTDTAPCTAKGARRSAILRWNSNAPSILPPTHSTISARFWVQGILPPDRLLCPNPAMPRLLRLLHNRSLVRTLRHRAQTNTATGGSIGASGPVRTVQHRGACRMGVVGGAGDYREIDSVDAKLADSSVSVCVLFVRSHSLSFSRSLALSVRAPVAVRKGCERRRQPPVRTYRRTSAHPAEGCARNALPDR